jgi:hypothetical protein
MATLMLDQTVLPTGDDYESLPADSQFAGAGGVHGRLTLDDVITGVWEDLAVRAAVRCPVCEGEMAAHKLTGGLRRGQCGDCGTRLS